MIISDKAIETTLKTGGYVRRAYWPEVKACYRLTNYGVMEFGYLYQGMFGPLQDDDYGSFSLEYDDIVADDWEIVS